MLKEAIQYLVSLKDNKTYEINGETYSDAALHRIPEHVDRPDTIFVNGLDSIAQLVRHELDTEENFPVFIRAVSPRKVEVFGTLDSHRGRNHLYEATCDAAEFKPGWREQETAIIELRSIFAPGEDVDYLLDLLSRISKEDAVTSEDNGMSQSVTTRQGIALKRTEMLKQRVSLAPFRTFTEISQPSSEFILRMDENGRVGLLEADGGAWKLKAKEYICEYFATALREEITQGKVVVMR